MGTVVMHNVVSVDGFIADANDQVGPLFDWYSNGDVPLGGVGQAKVSKVSAEYVKPMWAGLGVLVVGRHVFDITNGWEGTPPAGEHIVVVSHRPRPEGWHPDAPFHFVDGVPEAIAKAQELAGDRNVGVAAGDVGGQAFALGLVDEVAMDVVPVVFGSGKRYFGSTDTQHLLDDPHTVIRGDRVLHLLYRVRR
ncbi:dihydrofolate reductase family protein [Streptomyces sp. CA-210063]|uniref:dihydrofolate reductase family protein n=1 Tax=Streptomyces sp. CA-210063 TaxID=2801029 RepID=UPI00214C5503|nr:dihydrofolate reductase family protein [Streptomyces sp. CA-210063]UUU32461.1 dihydrofolate reductase family protein [Streptomyces sp. CA-210063]